MAVSLLTVLFAFLTTSRSAPTAPTAPTPVSRSSHHILEATNDFVVGNDTSFDSRQKHAEAHLLKQRRAHNKRMHDKAVVILDRIENQREKYRKERVATEEQRVKNHDENLKLSISRVNEQEEKANWVKLLNELDIALPYNSSNLFGNSLPVQPDGTLTK
eukprot:jgi/Bigna1/128048/aug1.5_g2756